MQFLHNSERGVVRERQPHVPEEQVIALWLRELQPERRFRLRDGRTLRVIDAGKRNRYDGPDFLDATVVIDDRLIRGAIEVHTREGDWKRHGHTDDIRYRQVVLHVCMYAETPGQRASGMPPLLILAREMGEPLRSAWSDLRRRMHPFPCAASTHTPHPSLAAAMLTLTAAERFARKCLRLEERLLELADEAQQVDEAEGKRVWRQLLYEAVARATGYGGNEEETAMLAHRLPLEEAVLLGDDERFNRFAQIAGLQEGEVDAMIAPHIWRNSRVRPNNRIHSRLRWFSAWCVQVDQRDWWRRCLTLLKERKLRSFEWQPLFTVQATGERPGRDRCFEHMVNVLAPILHLYGRWMGDEEMEHRAMELYFNAAPAAPNRHTLALEKAFDRRCADATDQQGMIELHTQYCLKCACASCLCASE
ncbi:DUF2851 family protein [bacterium]|nr:DUF2851 family protein [bacterium]